jgi:hypothetical protein
VSHAVLAAVVAFFLGGLLMWMRSPSRASFKEMREDRDVFRDILKTTEEALQESQKREKIALGREKSANERHAKREKIAREEPCGGTRCGISHEDGMDKYCSCQSVTTALLVKRRDRIRYLEAELKKVSKTIASVAKIARNDDGREL